MTIRSAPIQSRSTRRLSSPELRRFMVFVVVSAALLSVFGMCGFFYTVHRAQQTDPTVANLPGQVATADGKRGTEQQEKTAVVGLAEAYVRAAYTYGYPDANRDSWFAAAEPLMSDDLGFATGSDLPVNGWVSDGGTGWDELRERQLRQVGTSTGVTVTGWAKDEAVAEATFQTWLVDPAHPEVSPQDVTEHTAILTVTRTDRGWKVDEFALHRASGSQGG